MEKKKDRGIYVANALIWTLALTNGIFTGIIISALANGYYL